MLEIFLWNGKFLFKGNEFTGNYHRHHPLQILASFTDSITVSTPNGAEVSSRVLVVDSNVDHVCRNHGTSISLLIDPETLEGKAFKQNHISGPVSPLALDTIDHLQTDFEDFRKTAKPDIAAARRLVDALLFSFTDKGENITETDERIRRILRLLPEVPDKKIAVGELAARVGLSETRLIHLFKKEVGTPIRRYLLWKRLLDAILFIKDGQTLTMAAHEAGFSDYAHFSRTFKCAFGSKVENIFKNDRFVHVHICE